MSDDYKTLIMEYLEQKNTEVHIKDIYEMIEKKIPKYRKSGSKYLREVITNRYKGSDTFYINNDYVGLLIWKNISNEENDLSVIVSYYLSRFNNLAYEKLGYGNQTETHKQLGKILNVKPNTIKNRRDKFDPHFNDYGNDRQGWHRPEPDKFIIKTIEKYKSFSEEEIYSLVNQILSQKNTNIINFENIDPDVKSYLEGEIQEIKILSRKRNKSIVKECKKRDSYRCLACGFYFENKIVESHHLNPLYQTGEDEVCLNDLITLCPTCHRLVHYIISKENKKEECLRIKYQDPEVIINSIKEALNAKRT